MTRNILLVAKLGALFKDHWTIFIPGVESPSFGTLIEVEGDVRSGFTHSLIRNYDLKAERRSVKVTLLGEVDDNHVHATPPSGIDLGNDTHPRDDVERIALAIAAPGPSMNTISGDAVRLYLMNPSSVLLM